MDGKDVYSGDEKIYPCAYIDVDPSLGVNVVRLEYGDFDNNDGDACNLAKKKRYHGLKRQRRPSCGHTTSRMTSNCTRELISFFKKNVRI